MIVSCGMQRLTSSVIMGIIDTVSFDIVLLLPRVIVSCGMQRLTNSVIMGIVDTVSFDIVLLLPEAE